MAHQQSFRIHPYARDLETRVTGHTDEGGIYCADSIFYPTGGGQPGDSGRLIWDGGMLEIATAVKAAPDVPGAPGAPGAVVLVPAEPAALPPVGTRVRQELDWERRHRHMRVHTALHLLSVAIPHPVTGGQIGVERGRLDFDMAEKPDDIAALEAMLNGWIAQDLPVRESWISDAQLAAQPELVKTLSVAPPRGQDWVRLIAIGPETAPIDLQPCGGTHVASLHEIGALRIGKIEKKGRQNRRVYLHLC